MSVHKTILIAHRQRDVRARFAAALADARHAYVQVDTAEAAAMAAGDRTAPLSLVLLDFGIGIDPVTLIRTLRQAAGAPLAVVGFAATVPHAALVRALAEAGVSGYVNDFAAAPQILPALAPHLFPDNFDRRASRRVKLGVPVSVQIGDRRLAAHALNLSKGGLAIRTLEPLPVSTPVHVTFRLPGVDDDLVVAGRIRWSDPRVGMGLQFEQVDGRAASAIERFVE